MSIEAGNDRDPCWSRRAWLARGARWLGTGVALGGVAPWLAASTSRASHMAADQRASWSRMARQVLLNSLPRSFSDEEEWGTTKPIAVGLNFKDETGHFKLSKKTREVNHGLWKRSEVRLIDPEESLDFQIIDAQSKGPQRVAFQLTAAAALACEVRFERWRMGLKMLNGSGEADARLGAQIRGDVAYRLDSDSAARTAVHLAPNIEQVELKLLNFDLRRVGKLDGPVIHELGEAFTGMIQRQLTRQEPRVLEKMNVALVERRDTLKIDLPQTADLGWIPKFQWGSWFQENAVGKIESGAEKP